MTPDTRDARVSPEVRAARAAARCERVTRKLTRCERDEAEADESIRNYFHNGAQND